MAVLLAPKVDPTAVHGGRVRRRLLVGLQPLLQRLPAAADRALRAAVRGARGRLPAARGVYDPVSLLRRERYARGIGARGLAALLLGMAVAALCVNTPDYTGPISKALDGADVSALAGALVAATR
jgi:hypothetical protein